MLPKVRYNLPPENVNSGTAQTREGVRERGLDQLAIIEQKQDKSYLALALCVVNQTVFWGIVLGLQGLGMKRGLGKLV